MLKKLIKHEWAATWKIYGVINLYMIIITLLSALTGIFTVSQDEPNELVILFAVSVVVVYYLSILGVVVAPNFYSGIRFYKNFYADEGYLMHTLPVSKNQLILSKLSVGLIWSVISSAIAGGSVFVIVMSIVSVLDKEHMMAEVMDELNVGLAYVQDQITTPIWVFVVVFLLVYLISYAAGVMNFYASVSLGQLAKRYKILMSIVAYIGIQTVMQFISGFLQLPFQLFVQTMELDSAGDFEMFLWIMIGFTFILSALLVAVYYTITYVVMKKKVNLE